MPYRAYIRDIQKNLLRGDATEQTHRPALKALLEALGENMTATNEPKPLTDVGKPDMRASRGSLTIGYIETKDVGKSLDAELRLEQLKRYLTALPNLILTNYLEFRWFVDGEHRRTARLAFRSAEDKLRAARGGREELAALLEGFLSQEPVIVGRPEELAQRMAALARLTRDTIEETFAQEADGRLHTQFAAFRDTLIPALSPSQFADMYAQTIAYGLFAARAHHPTATDFTRQSAAWNLPPTNPFLQRLFSDIAGPGLDERIAWAVDDLAELLRRADMEAILKGFGRRAGRERDPVLHFYETFLAKYDPRERRRRGVYYTPEAVVSYIVASLDWLLRERFGREAGLADEGVHILDPAVGTGTFLYFVIQQVYESVIARGQRGAWNDYVRWHILPRIFGFELLMAPYTIAHMKLGLLLRDTGYDFQGEERLGIYLTNALEQAILEAEALPFAKYITDESNAAAEVKRVKPIMVVLGNPPYSVGSANKGKHIEALMASYKEAVRLERNIQPLSDDYIKFIRFAQDRIERTGYGVIGMITNNAYLSGLIHRGMREELLKAFDEIYILNLHGNARMGETAPDGGKDENVFDIQQGVAIALFVKGEGAESLARVRYADLWGLREGKYQYLFENEVATTEWQELEPEATPNFFFVPKDLDLLSEYERGWSMADVFPVTSTGIKTHRDRFVIDFEEAALRARIAAFRDPKHSDEEVRERFKLRDTRDWNLTEARAKLQARKDWEDDFSLCLYRPFDVRPIYYSGDVIELPRRAVMRHMLAGENVALVACRQFAARKYFTMNCSDKLTEISSQPYAPLTLFPLYLYTTPEARDATLFEGGEVEREPNLSPAFIAALSERIGLRFVPDGKGDLETSWGPENAFHYAYAVFHSLTYRERYAEFLKIDFPRLPLTSDLSLFRTLTEKGEELVGLHLMQTARIDASLARDDIHGSNEVERVRYEPPSEGGARRVYINEEQYFEGIPPEVWGFQIGGYQVCEKWLRDRRRRVLSFDDVSHYQRIAFALRETIRLMAEIDGVIPSWPLEW